MSTVFASPNVSVHEGESWYKITPPAESKDEAGWVPFSNVSVFLIDGWNFVDNDARMLYETAAAPLAAERNLREQLAEIEHERWADWQRYLHSLCTKNDDGSLTIPAERVSWWERQIATPYYELTEREKDSDREQVDRYWHLIQKGNNQ